MNYYVFIVLISLQHKGCFPAVYDIEDLSAVDKTGVSPLDSNHTHFILVDDGTHNKAGREIDFRADIEQFIAKEMHLEQGNMPLRSIAILCCILDSIQNRKTLRISCRCPSSSCVACSGRRSKHLKHSEVGSSKRNACRGVERLWSSGWLHCSSF